MVYAKELAERVTVKSKFVPGPKIIVLSNVNKKRTIISAYTASISAPTAVKPREKRSVLAVVVD